MNKKIIVGLITGAVIAGAVITGAAINLNVNEKKTSATITFSNEEEAQPAELAPEIVENVTDIETGHGEIKVNGEEIKTVESVESDGPVTEVNNTNCPEGEECGRGATVPDLDISSPQAFTNQTLGQCIDADGGYFGAQCWDLGAAFWLNYVGRTLTTCGTGAAKGTIADGCWQKNAGNDFTMIWDKTQIVAGDIVVFSTGTWGHIGMATGSYNNGYITLLGQNQGGRACQGGGAATNIINISTRDFIGAFRPNIYIKPVVPEEPKKEEPVNTQNKCESWTLKKGDTLGEIMLYCEGKVEWGQAMQEYAKTWYSPAHGGLVVWNGWHFTANGVGLYAGDTIVRVKN